MSQLACEKIVLPDGVLATNVTVEISEGRITNITQESAVGEKVAGIVVPGFVDTHCHGGAGADFSDPDPAAVERALSVHLSHGTTTLFASTVTEDVDILCQQIARLRPFVESGRVAGIHLEGPFLSPAKKGAHREHLLIDPTPEVVGKLLAAGEGIIKMVTLAPERPNGLAAIKQFQDAGVQVAFGHTDADEQTTAAALEAGVHVTTHLFNAMRGIHHRHPGPIPKLLDSPGTFVEMICDGIHLHRDVVAMAIDAAGADRVMLITDAMSATGQPDGDYHLGGLPVAVRNGAAMLVNDDGGLGALAGSTLTMDRAFSFIVNQVGLPVTDAVKLASTNPARAHGLDDVGQIAVGKFADLCVVDTDAKLVRVMRHGEWVK